MRLYHATYKDNIPSIKEKGLIPHYHKNFDGMDMNDCLYFAFNPETALCYLENSDTYDGQDIMILSIDTNKLDTQSIRYDWNNKCEYESNINSIAYSGSIPFDNFHICTREEIEDAPEHHLLDFKHDDSCIYEIIGSVFDEEVETNLERE